MHLADLMEIRGCPYQALDSSATAIRDAKRRGERWLAGRADIGWSKSLGWYEGFRLLAATDPTGVITGFGLCAASAADQQVAESYFALLHRPSPRLPGVGSAFWSGAYVADKGFEGEENHKRSLDRYGVRIIHPPKRTSRERMSTLNGAFIIPPSRSKAGRRYLDTQSLIEVRA